EEQLLLIGGGAHLHQRPRPQNIFLDRRPDPPHGVGGEAEAFVRLEALDRLHQADIALRNHFGDRQAVAAIAHGDLGDEAQMTVDELVCRLMVAVLAPALGQHEFVLRFQHRDPPDFLKIAGDAGFGRHRQPSHDLNRIVGTVVTVAFNYFRNTIICIYPHCQFDFETLLFGGKGRPCEHAKRQSSCCWRGGLCKPRAITANSAPPNGWRFATSPAPIRSPGPRRHLRSFKRPPAAPLRRRSRHLRRGGAWSGTDRRPTGEGAVCGRRGKGKKALLRDPFEVLVRAVDLLDAKERTVMHHALHQVLTALAASGAHRRFGVCQDCMYLSGETRCNLTSASSSAPECLLLGVPIEPEDVDLLCVHFRPTSEHNDGAYELTSAICGKDA